MTSWSRTWMITLSGKENYDKAGSVLEQFESSLAMDASSRDLCALRSGQNGPIPKHGQATSTMITFHWSHMQATRPSHRMRTCAEDGLRTAMTYRILIGQTWMSTTPGFEKAKLSAQDSTTRQPNHSLVDFQVYWKKSAVPRLNH